jgi:hypothetical protein
VYLTARSYLLAGFTATSIVAALSAPATTAHLPAIQAAEVRLSAADSEIASKIRTFRDTEVRTVASMVDHAATVVGDLANPSGTPAAGATANSLAPSSLLDTSLPADGTNERKSDAVHHIGAAAAPSFDPSTLGPLVGDIAAFNFDLLGAPFALVTALDVGTQVAIADLSTGMVQNLLKDVTFSVEFNLGTPLTRLTADIRNLTDVINEIADAKNNPPPDAAGTAGAPQTPATVNPGRASAIRTPFGSADLSAIGPLIGNTAILGLEVAGVPFEAVTSVTNALSGAAQDLGAGEFEEAKAFAATQLTGDFRRIESNIARDLQAIGANVAQLTGTSNPTGSTVKTAIGSTATTADPHAASPASAQPKPTGTSGSRGATNGAVAAPVAKPVSSAPKHPAPHHPSAIGASSTAASASSTKVPEAPKRTSSNGSERTNESTGGGGATNDNTKPAGNGRGKTGDQGHHPTKPNGPSKAQHATGGKHRKK